MSRLGRPLGANTLPGRLEVQTNVRPSKDRLGCWSKAAELSGAPGFSGVDHGSFALRRVDTQRSARPSPPAGAPRWNQISFPSVRTVGAARSEEHTSELQSRLHLVCRLLLEKKKSYPTTTREA